MRGLWFFQMNLLLISGDTFQVSLILTVIVFYTVFEGWDVVEYVLDTPGDLKGIWFNLVYNLALLVYLLFENSCVILNTVTSR
jgi:hypothetical protein